jgi:hypothetical protein
MSEVDELQTIEASRADTMPRTSAYYVFIDLPPAIAPDLFNEWPDS